VTESLGALLFYALITIGATVLIPFLLLIALAIFGVFGIIAGFFGVGKYEK
jgi:hypothetical protein